MLPRRRMIVGNRELWHNIGMENRQQLPANLATREDLSTLKELTTTHESCHYLDAICYPSGQP